MKYMAIVKQMGEHPNTFVVGPVSIEADDVDVTDGVLVFRTADPTRVSGQRLLLAVPPGMWLHCEEEKLVQPASKLKLV